MNPANWVVVAIGAGAAYLAFYIAPYVKGRPFQTATLLLGFSVAAASLYLT